jgi:hypothetical protein
VSTALTPYDTGKRGEPHPWEIAPSLLEGMSPIERELEVERYGKVDFDNDEGRTIATVWIERDELGRAVVHIQALGDEVLVQVHS